MTELLKTIDLSKNFGGLAAVEKVSLSIDEGEKAVGIIGPNGSGKTTFFNMLTGFFLPSAGRILFQGEDITRISPNRRVLKGIARTFQFVSVFDRLTPSENLVLSSIRFGEEPFPMGVHAEKRSGQRYCGHMLRNAQTDGIGEGRRFEDLGIVLRVQANAGNRDRLSLKPKLLLLDEPLAGLSDFEIVEVVDVLKRIKGQLNLIIIEHKLSKILELVDRFVVLNEGRIICEGDPAQVLCDQAVRECYSGQKCNNRRLCIAAFGVFRMLKIDAINVSYGYAKVLHDVSLEIRQGEMGFIIGRNGAGKTTLLKSIIGLLTPQSGSILFQGQAVVGLLRNV